MGEIDSAVVLLKKIFLVFPKNIIGIFVMIIIIIATLFIVFLSVYPSLKSGYKEVTEDTHSLLNKILYDKPVRHKTIILTSILIAFLLLCAFLVGNKKIDNIDESKPFYPIAVDMKDVNIVGEWTYFIYEITDDSLSETYTYPALFRYKNDESAIRVSPRACFSYQVAGDSIFYMDSTMMVKDHGELIVSRPDGKNERLLDEDLYNFQIIDNKYIYYIYRHDTLGVGVDGHALYRINLDGTNKMIAAYEVSGFEFGGSHLYYTVKNGWVYGKDFRMSLGSPANGFEKIEILSDTLDSNDDWIYYVTNRLIKARKDGSEQLELDEIDSYHYAIDNVDENWVYYTKGGEKYKIKKDGTNKVALER